MRQQGQPLTYEQLCQQTTDETERLAYGLELLAKGAQLFKRQGGRWYPIEEAVVRKHVGFVQHLELLQAGEGAAVWFNGERWTLTGRSNWKFFEIRNHAGEVRNVRVNQVSEGTDYHKKNSVIGEGLADNAFSLSGEERV